jgi:hypothetical protein
LTGTQTLLLTSVCDIPSRFSLFTRQYYFKPNISTGRERDEAYRREYKKNPEDDFRRLSVCASNAGKQLSGIGNAIPPSDGGSAGRRSFFPAAQKASSTTEQLTNKASRTCVCHQPSPLGLANLSIEPARLVDLPGACTRNCLKIPASSIPVRQRPCVGPQRQQKGRGPSKRWPSLWGFVQFSSILDMVCFLTQRRLPWGRP